MGKEHKTEKRAEFYGGKIDPWLPILFMLAQLLRQSGLINVLIWAVTKLGLNAGFIPLIGFLVCMLISTSCGTSTGSATAVAPVLLPLASSLGIDMGFMCGAIISGAIFGDNLAPISDTTISSALTKEEDLGKVVRTRFPYAAISALVSAVLFTVAGLRMSSGAPAAIKLDGSTAKSLVLLLLPVLMVILMRMGWASCWTWRWAVSLPEKCSAQRAPL